MKKLKKEAKELINCGNSKEKAEGYGMMKVIAYIEMLHIYELWNEDLNSTTAVIRVKDLNKL
jgi:hypothetical protein